jgi:hypothetical protein
VNLEENTSTQYRGKKSPERILEINIIKLGLE